MPVREDATRRKSADSLTDRQRSGRKSVVKQTTYGGSTPPPRTTTKNRNDMTDKDRDLIAAARALHYTEWGVCGGYAAECDTEEARSIINGIASDLNHIEEYHSGLL